MSYPSTAMRLRRQNQVAHNRLPLLLPERVGAPGYLATSGLRYALSAWGLLVGGYLANDVGAVMGLVLLLAGSLMGAGLAAGASLPCNRYGLDPADAAKPCLGYRGAKVLLGVFLLSHLGWSGLMLVMFGRGVQNFLGALGLVPGNGVVSLMVILGIVATYTNVVRGDDSSTRLRALAMPCLVVIGGIVMFAVLHDIAWQDLLRIPPLTPRADARQSVACAFECALGVGLSWWPCVARSSRCAEGLRAGFYAPWLSLSLATTALGTAGLCAALLLRNYDPTQWLIFLGGRAFGALTLVIVIITNLAVVARMMHTAALGLQHVPKVRSWGWRWCVALLFAPLLIFAAYPNALFERGDAIITIHGYVLAPLCCVMIIDHMFFRPQRLNITQVFEAQAHGHYWFVNGFNPWAWLAVSLGVATAWALYCPLTLAIHPWANVAGATLPGAGVASGVYVAASWLARKTFAAGLGGYGRESTPTPVPMADIF